MNYLNRFKRYIYNKRYREDTGYYLDHFTLQISDPAILKETDEHN